MIPTGRKFALNIACVLLISLAIGCAGKQTHTAIKTKKLGVAEGLPATLSPIDLPPNLIAKKTTKKKVSSKKTAVEENKKIALKDQADVLEQAKKKVELIEKEKEAAEAKAVQEAMLDSSLSKEISGKDELIVNSPHLASLGANWNNNAFKYLAIDGDRYTYDVILNYVKGADNNSVLRLNSNGELQVALDESFEMEIAFYAPNTEGHETFKPFQLIVVNQNKDTVYSKTINNRIQIYTVNK